MIDIDTTGWTVEEITAWRWYQSAVESLDGERPLTFYDARLLVDAYAAWVEIFDAPQAKYHIAFLRQQIARREFS